MGVCVCVEGGGAASETAAAYGWRCRVTIPAARMAATGRAGTLCWEQLRAGPKSGEGRQPPAWLPNPALPCSARRHPPFPASLDRPRPRPRPRPQPQLPLAHHRAARQAPRVYFRRAGHRGGRGAVVGARGLRPQPRAITLFACWLVSLKPQAAAAARPLAAHGAPCLGALACPLNAAPAPLQPAPSPSLQPLPAMTISCRSPCLTPAARAWRRWRAGRACS
jgi:hypothetical protein